jgi:hypothetical protein
VDTKLGEAQTQPGSEREEKNYFLCQKMTLVIKILFSSIHSTSNANAFSNDQESGVIVRGSKRMQMNIFLTRMKDINVLNNVSEGLFPVFWIEEVSYQQYVVCRGNMKKTLALKAWDFSSLPGYPFYSVKKHVPVMTPITFHLSAFATDAFYTKPKVKLMHSSNQLEH